MRPTCPIFGVPFGLAVGGGCASPAKKVTGPCSPSGHLYVGGTQYGNNVWEYTQNGEYIRVTYTGALYTTPLFLKADPLGNLYDAYIPFGKFGDESRVFTQVPRPGTQNEIDSPTKWGRTGRRPASHRSVTEEVPAPANVHPDRRRSPRCPRDHYAERPRCPTRTAPAIRLDSFGSRAALGTRGMAVDGDTHRVYVANDGSDEVARLHRRAADRNHRRGDLRHRHQRDSDRQRRPGRPRRHLRVPLRIRDRHGLRERAALRPRPRRQPRGPTSPRRPTSPRCSRGSRREPPGTIGSRRAA